MEKGKKIPKFKLSDQSGEEKQFADLAGPNGLVLYAYPKDNTSGCTAEAQEFRDELNRLSEMGYGLAGLSKDSVKSHQNFAAKHELNFPLLSDPETGFLQALGAWGEKKMAGKTYQGTIRSTYVFDSKGKLTKSYDKVKAKGHAQKVVEDLKDVSGS